MSTDTDASSTLALGEINKYDFRTNTPSVFKARRGLDRDIVSQISEMKQEPTWMRDFRLKSLDIFNSKPMPKWGGNIGIDFQDIFYYLKPAEQQGKTWEEVPEEIKKTFDRLGIPEAERKFLSGVKAQFESEVVYGSLAEDLAKKGVIFTDTDTAVREHPDLLKEYFGSIIPPTDNKFAALNSAVWSGAPSFTSLRESQSSFLFKHISASTLKVWVSLNEHSLLLMRVLMCITSKDAPRRCILPKACIRQLLKLW